MNHLDPLGEMAFAALPNTVRERYFRGDSACYETDLLQWLSSPERQRELGGGIGFAISAVMSRQLAQAIEAVLAGGVDDEASNRLQSEPCDGCDSGRLIRVRGHSLTLSIIASHAWRRLDGHSMWRRWEATGCVLYWPT